MPSIRVLTADDAGAFQMLRLRGLRESPAAFGGLKSRHKASVFAMYVSPDARGHGVGRALVARLIEHARAWDGVDRLTLTVTVTQEAARALYRAAGFHVFGSEPDGLRQDGEPMTMEHMTLSLRDQ